MIENPFYYEGPLICGKNDTTMIWRHHFLDQVIDDINRAKNPLIIGPRQIGKTTLTYQLKHKIQNLKKIDIVIIIQMGELAGANESNLIEHLVNCIIHSLPAELDRINKKHYFNEIKIITDQIRRDNCYEFSRYLSQLQSMIEEVRRIILIFDELEVLEDTLLYKFLGVFRQMASNSLLNKNDPKYSIVLVCQKDLSTFDLGKASPYNINVTTHRISNCNENEIENMLSNKFSKNSIRRLFSDDAMKFLVHETNGHPYLFQRISSHAVDIINERDSLQIEIQDAIIAIMRLFELGDRNLRITLDSIQKLEQTEIISDLLMGKKIPFERALPEIYHLENNGIVIKDQKHNICCFRTTIYERIFLKEYFSKLTTLKGKYLAEDATLLIRISELQRILLNENYSKYIYENIPKHSNLIEALKKLLKTLYDNNKVVFNTDVIKSCLIYWQAEIAVEKIEVDDILKILAMLYLEKIELADANRVA